jgi:transglutaminase-like putative cysteine protease
MPSILRIATLVYIVSITTAAIAADSADTKSPQNRKFKFAYGATIEGLKPGDRARVWVPVATSNDEQNVRLDRILLPARHQITSEKKHGNQMIYFEVTADSKGQINLDVDYTVERREVLLSQSESAGKKIHPEFISTSKMIPVDGSLLKKVAGDKQPSGSTIEKARTLYDAVDDLMKYDKPEGGAWGRGDATWACDSKYGNCTDFHSVFIGACRDLKIPAKFEMGFPIPEKRGAGEVGGYHCWAKFLDDNSSKGGSSKWVAVDISEADKNPKMKEYYFGNLTADRVTFTTGRDLELTPAPAAGPVNFLVYPYVEVAGKPHTKFIKRFKYADVE